MMKAAFALVLIASPPQATTPRRIPHRSMRWSRRLPPVAATTCWTADRARDVDILRQPVIIGTCRAPAA